MGDLDWRPNRENSSEYRQRQPKRYPPGRGGRKRGREEPEDSPSQLFIRDLMDLGDEGSKPSLSIEKQIEDYLPRLHREIKSSPGMVKDTLIACSVELPAKTPHYATLIGFLNVEDEDFVKGLIQQASSEFYTSLQTANRHRARLLLRLFAALVVSNVLLPSSVVECLDSLVTYANSYLDSEDASGRSWQPWTDFMVSSVLLALPWGASELADSAPTEFSEIFTKAEKYVRNRPIQNDSALRPFLASIKEDDEAAKSDSGGASFLGDLWAAINDLKDNGAWRCKSIPKLSHHIEHKLAAGHPIALPNNTTPKGPLDDDGEMSFAEKCAKLNRLFPPRGGISLLDPVHTNGGLPSIEKIIVEEYILDVLHFFQEDRVGCAQRLAKSLPAPYPISPLLAEVLFSQMLMIPQPPLRPVAYGTLMVNLCQFTDLGPFPRGLSGCVRELFLRMPVLDPGLSMRMAEWLSFHLSNLNFIWPWQKWKRVLEAPEHDPQRLFIRHTLGKLVDLSYLGFVKEKIEAKEFHDLLPPPAKAKPLQMSPDMEITQGDTPDLHGSEKKENDAEVKEEPNQESIAVQEDEKEVDHATKVTSDLLELLRKKESVDTVLGWMKEQEFESNMGGNTGSLKAVTHAVLLAGCRSTTHTTKVMERYSPILKTYAEKVEKANLLDSVVDVWESSRHRVCLIITKMISIGLLTGQDAVEWAFGMPGIATLGTGEDVLRYWEVVQCSIEQSLAAVNEAHDDIRRAETTVRDAEDAAQNAAHIAADAAERVEQDEGDNTIMVNRITAANREESKARQDLELAIAQVAEKKSRASEAESNQQSLIMKVFQSFALILRDDPPADSGCDEDWNSLRLFYRNLAHLASFTRLYSLSCAKIQSVLQTEVFCEGAVCDVARKVLDLNLRLGGVVEDDHDIFSQAVLLSKRKVEEMSQVDAEEKSCVTPVDAEVEDTVMEE